MSRSGLSTVAQIFAGAGIKVQPARPAAVSDELYALMVGRLRMELEACAVAADRLDDGTLSRAERDELGRNLAKALHGLESRVAAALKAAFGMET